MRGRTERAGFDPAIIVAVGTVNLTSPGQNEAS